LSKKQILWFLGNVLFIQAGAVLAAFLLERFIVPNRIMDGGIDLGLGVDEDTFISIHNVHEAIGKNVRKGE